MKIYKLERHGHLLMLKAFIEGPEGKAYPRLLLDTGSTYTIISQEMASQPLFGWTYFFSKK